MVLLLRTGLRIAELAELDASDVRLTQRTGELVLRHGNGESPSHRACVASNGG
jgi:site-specific recombinase XerD